MLHSAGVRVFVLGFLALLMCLPTLFVADIIDSRADYNRETLHQIGRDWGGAQDVSGPVMILPVYAMVTTTRQEHVADQYTGLLQRDAEGELLLREVSETVRQTRPPVMVMPEALEGTIASRTEIRERGIFSVPVFVADIDLDAQFDAKQAETALKDNEQIDWDAARLEVLLSDNRGLRGRTEVFRADASLEIQPLNDGRSGLLAEIGDPREKKVYSVKLGLNGSRALQFSPVGKQTQIDLRSDWPHPSFVGAFLPDTREITETGFVAEWSIPHLARSLRHISRVEDRWQVGSEFGVRFFQPNDFYQKSYRAAQYGLLFIALTFATIFLVDLGRKTPAHPVQYLMIGSAQVVFFLLLVALAEQIGFGRAYVLSAVATIGLITAFARVVLLLESKAAVLGGGLTVLYAALYLILQSSDYALLAGSILSFCAIAVTMFATRGQTWYGDPQAFAWPRRKPKEPTTT